MSTELVPSLSIENLLQRRDLIAERVTEAERLLSEAYHLATTSFDGDGKLYLSSHVHLSLSDRSAFTTERYMKEVDIAAWSLLMRESGLKSFLDAETRKKWRDAIERRDVPELTPETIKATFAQLYDERGKMFERGVIEVFRNLSWSYKTNQPVKFGKKLIMEFVVERSNYGRDLYLYGVHHRAADRLDDLIRVLSILDGKPEPDHRNGAYAKLMAAGWMKNDSDVDLYEFDYFTLKGYRNGNAHLTFTRLDLVDKLNRILTKHHPNALPPAR